MSSDYYFKKWKDVLTHLDVVVDIDQEYQDIKSHDQKLCGLVQKLSGVLGSYIYVYNEAVECMNQGLQVQKTKYISDIVHTITKRIVEIKHQLSKLEHSNYQFSSRGVVNFRLTTADTEFKDIPEKGVRSSEVQDAIDGVWVAVRELKEKLAEEERQRELEAQKPVGEWWDAENNVNNKGDKYLNENEEELDEEQIEKRKMINMIIAQEKTRQVTKRLIHEKLKRDMWEKVLLGLNKPEKRLEVRNRAAALIQKFARLHFALKRKKLADCQRDSILGLQICKRPSDEAKFLSEKITARRTALKRKYDEEWKNQFERLKNKCIEEKGDEIQEDYRDEIRNWFHKWYKEVRFFYDIPKTNQGGSILILKEETPSPAEWKELNQAYIEQTRANKSKSPEQLKLEKKQAKQEAQKGKKEEAQKRKMEEKMLQKMMKNPQMHPGFQYPQSNVIVKIIEAIQNYHREWDRLDDSETVAVKEKFVNNIDKDNAWAEVKLELRPHVDDDMRNELKTLKQALKAEYESAEEQWPTVMPQKFPKIPHKKPAKVTMSDKILEKMIDLVMKGYLREYPKRKFEDFKGDPNFAGDDLRCNFIRAVPHGGETRNVWWEKCRELVHGFQKILLVGPKGSGKSLLAYAMATVNDAVLFELDIGPAYFGDTSADELNELAKSIIACAKAAQPAVIYIKYVHRLFYTKMPPEEPVLDKQLLNKCLVKKLTKKFHKTDKVTVIGCCRDPWLTKSSQLLKQFPTVVMMPNTTYSTTGLMLRDWIKRNRVVPPDFDVSCLAQVLQGYSYGYLQNVLDTFLTGERIARIAAKGLQPQEIFDVVLNDESETRVEYDNYLKWYSEKTNWGILEKKHIEAQHEFEELAKKYAEKSKKKRKTGMSTASSVVSSLGSIPK